MKKFFILLIVFAFCCPVFADVFVPQWSEFCPPQFVNGQPKDHSVFSKILINTREDNKIYDYWVQRKIDFYNSLNNCNQYPPEQINQCYQQIRQSESNKSLTFYQYQQLQQTDRNNYLKWQGILSRMNPIYYPINRY